MHGIGVAWDLAFRFFCVENTLDSRNVHTKFGGARDKGNEHDGFRGWHQEGPGGKRGG